MLRKFYNATTTDTGGDIKQATAAVLEMKTAQETFLNEQKKASEDSKKELEETKKQLKETRDNLDKVIKAQDQLIAEAQKQQLNVPGAPLYDQLGKALTEKEALLKAYKEGSGKGFTIQMDRKVMSSAGNLTGSYFVPPTLVPGVILQPYEEVHMRNILPVGQTNSNVIRYVRDNGSGNSNVPLTVAEGATKPEIDRDLQILDAPVRKIACYMRVPEEMIEDIPYLQSFLTQIGIEEVMLVEDEQILYGNNAGQNLSGLIPNATAFDTGLLATVDAPNEFDILRAARTQGRLAKRRPTVALVNPGDYYNMTSRKDSTNNYLFLGGGNGIQPGRNVDGLTIIDHTIIEPGDWLVLDPRAAAIFDRTGMSVRFYDQDQDNAIKNLITIVIEKRLALPIYYTNGLITGTFEAVS
jgi:HK97 family phage major capsid protein